MDITLFSVLALGFILGIKHAVEPDHVIAVSTIASQSKKLWQASLAGVFWGIGHTATLFLIGILLIFLKEDISDKWSMSLEFLVGIMLVYLGAVSMLSIRKKSRANQPGSSERNWSKKGAYLKSLLIGTIHGLAGSAAMVLLTMSTVNSIWHGALFILIFGVGTVAGMLFFTTVIGIPFILSLNRFTLSSGLVLTTGALSAIFGIYYMYNLGFNEGLFSMWV
ncbi:sulfite exporter TauE/SafE family protein [Bacillus sp. B-jedd]|uniref:sulfite exporter TauE/SafE family protein n=1 Tax=Bacillus sp. B-jedd TaxID=1476857 RepID=UPI0005156B92|nr:sulfite exporter TauE/SafE family protein [Bacillus sp. B-jedd]CEG25524.1 high-affinity nickel-transporter [Bacillus sp. B-jedd]